jgi:integrase
MTMGSVYRQKYKTKQDIKVSKHWSIKYSVPDRADPIRETLDTEDEDEARSILREREHMVSKGMRINPSALLLEEMAADFLRDYKNNGKKSIDKAARSARYIVAYFTNKRLRRAKDITTSAVKQFIDFQIDQEFSNAEINRKSAALKRMFNLAIEHEKFFSTPHFPRLDESSPREGFFETYEFRAVHRELSNPVKPVAVFAFYLGWRVREITGLQWKDVSLQNRWVRIGRRRTKGKENREIFLPDEVYDILLNQRMKTLDLERQQGRIIPWVFHRDGNPIKDFRWDWQHACRRAGVPGKYFHDFRRTAYRNMTHLGIPEAVMRDIIGHRTQSMAERYGISDPRGRQEAARRLSGIELGIMSHKTESAEER